MASHWGVTMLQGTGTASPRRKTRSDRLQEDGMPEEKDIIEMPSNRPGKKPQKKGSGLVWILIICIGIAAGALWLLRDVLVTNVVPERATTDQTGTQAALAPAPEQGPPPGLADMLAAGGNGTRPDAAVAANGTQVTGVVGNATQPTPAVPMEDAVVRYAFVEDLASWLVTNYHPRGTHPEARKSGFVSAGLKAANLRYGTGMTGLSWSGESLAAGRSAVLAYAFTSPMLDALYRMYADRFMAAVAEAAAAPRDGKTLTVDETKEMYRLYAKRFRALSGAFEAASGMKDFSRRVGAWTEASDAAADANASFMETLNAYETARDNGTAQEAEAARKLMDISGKRYQQSIMMRERARETLAEAMRSRPEARGLDDDTLVYVAMWVQRRVQGAPERMDAVRMAAKLAGDLGSRFEAAASAPAAGAPLPAAGGAGVSATPRQ
ncbi:hypothetical protein [Nitratidesulfovibrio vulgaris]|uniref:Uncharacterized protein n=1 Tax=Nitratidesulfovibrio vulgaris (strain DP4) TaxID=391774 RepID=A0A0H3A8Q8_NITV4|nr:hypothetical protein [Nitratidesulfovibrio vulgaris]ABM29000.1 conserved hypothetical protein [Nitratidesulfovibrio vulgaris DP4]